MELSDPAALAAMLDVKRAVNEVLVRIRKETPRVDKGVVILALVALAQEGLLTCKPGVRRQLLEAIVPFLSGETVQLEGEPKALIQLVSGSIKPH